MEFWNLFTSFTRHIFVDSAELLYLNLLSGKFDALEIGEESKEVAMELLTQVSWESDQISSIADAKRRIYELLGFEYLAPQKSTKSSVKRAAIDELDSYETLVKEAGY